MTSRDMMRLAPRSIMQLLGRLQFYLSFIVDNRHCCHRCRHLRAQTALNYHQLRRRHFTGTNRPFRYHMYVGAGRFEPPT